MLSRQSCNYMLVVPLPSWKCTSPLAAAAAAAQGSGVIAVCVYGLYGSATSRWGMLARDEATGIHEAVWDTLAFVANGLIFFWGGISAVNFLLRCVCGWGGQGLAPAASLGCWLLAICCGWCLW